VPAQPAVPAGWYPHPTAPGWEAYWDGAAWGAETRPAQQPAAPAAEPVTEAQPQAAETTPGAEAAVPAAGVAAGGAAAGQQAAVPAAEVSATTTTAQTAAPAAVPAQAPAERSDASLPLVLSLLGAVVAIVGSFLPMASVDVFDLADNTLVGQQFGIAVIAVAVIGAIIAGYSYLKAYRTPLVILLGVVIVAIAVYAGLVGVDDMEASGLPNLNGLGGAGQSPDPQTLDTISQATQGGDLEPSASTGIFVTAVGGLLMLLGGIGIARQPK
jgi:hypothetical protein